MHNFVFTASCKGYVTARTSPVNKYVVMKSIYVDRPKGLSCFPHSLMIAMLLLPVLDIFCTQSLYCLIYTWHLIRLIRFLFLFYFIKLSVNAVTWLINLFCQLMSYSPLGVFVRLRLKTFYLSEEN